MQQGGLPQEEGKGASLIELDFLVRRERGVTLSMLGKVGSCGEESCGEDGFHRCDGDL